MSLEAVSKNAQYDAASFPARTRKQRAAWTLAAPGAVETCETMLDVLNA